MNSANRKSAAPAQVERRPFLVRFLAALLSGIAVFIPIAAGSGLFFDPLVRRRRRAESDGKDAENFLRVGPLDLLPADGTPRLFVLTADRSDAWTRMTKQRVGAVFLSREDVDGEPRLTAFAATCPHLGCTVDFHPAARQFACPCHEASFAADGSRISGPSQRGLDPLAVEIRRDGAGPANIYVAYQRFLPGIAERKPLA
jgi:Rieske Fe-S protein